MNLVDQKGCKMIIDTWMFEEKRYVIIENDTLGKPTIILAKSIINERVDERKMNNERTTKAIRNLGNVLILKLLAFNEIGGKLKVWSFKIPNYA